MEDRAELIRMQRQYFAAARRLTVAMIEHPNARRGLEKQLALHKARACQIALELCGSAGVAAPAVREGVMG